MALSRTPPRTVYCACGQPIGNERASRGYRRCTWCVEDFARRAVPRTRQVQVAIPSVLPAPPPAAVEREAETVKTALYVKTLRQARERADRDARGARFRELRASGLTIEQAIEQVEREDRNGHEDEDE